MFGFGFFFSTRARIRHAHVSRRVKVQGAAIHEATAWLSLTSRSAVTSCMPQRRSLQASVDVRETSWGCSHKYYTTPTTPPCSVLRQLQLQADY